MPPSSLAFSLGTWTLLLTVSGGLPPAEDRASAVPLLLDSDVRLVALFALPKMNVPPVARISAARHRDYKRHDRYHDGQRWTVRVSRMGTSPFYEPSWTW